MPDVAEAKAAWEGAHKTQELHPDWITALHDECLAAHTYITALEKTFATREGECPTCGMDGSAIGDLRAALATERAVREEVAGTKGDKWDSD